MSLKVTILYTELADYSIACFRTLKGRGAQIQLVHWPIKPEAPFHFDLSFLDEAISRDQLDQGPLEAKVAAFQPDAILCSGWMDDGYVKVCKTWKKGAVTILSLDNHWKGSIKQRIAALISPLTIRRAFSKAFVPGKIQQVYAHKLGFNSDDIALGFYAADTTKFEQFYEERKSNLTEHKRFLYLGRYVEHKGIFDLWEAFRLYKAGGGTWELWCVGTGDQYANRPEMTGLKHFGFIQPSDLAPVLNQSSVYILPSHFEPWGVSVHEMASAGFPLLLSDEIGAAERFLLPEENGRMFPARDPHLLALQLHWISELSSADLARMAERSHEVGMQHTPEKWVNQLLQLMKV
jgi:glycosyltransferase involved in cell wall biosynthesis